MAQVAQLKVALLREDLIELECALKAHGESTASTSATELDDTVHRVPFIEDLPFNGAAYYKFPRKKQPDWLSFVNQGLSTPLSLETATASTVLLIETKAGNRFALTYGYGRHFVRNDAIVHDFGILVGLNSVAPEGLRSLDTRRVEEVVIQTRRQVSKQSELNQFEVDKNRDLLQSIAGTPLDPTLCRRFEGADTFTAAVELSFRDLGDYLDRLVDQYRSEHYKEDYGFFDNIRIERDDNVIQALDEVLAAELSTPHPVNAYLAQPEPESLADINHYLYRRRGDEHLELDLIDLLHEYREADVSTTVESLRNHNIEVSYGHQGSATVAKWPVYNCLVFETELNGSVYMLASGSWHRAAPEFIEGIEATISAIATCDLALPVAGNGEAEVAYNARAASATGSYFTDRSNIHIPGHSAIELADLVTNDGKLVHVKRRTKSASLSHLFNQGLVSSSLLLTTPAFRSASQKMLNEIDPGGAPELDGPAFRPGNHEIIFAVIARPEVKLPGGLPLFSKVTLANVSRQISDMGYAVSFAHIPLQAN